MKRQLNGDKLFLNVCESENWEIVGLHSDTAKKWKETGLSWIWKKLGFSYEEVKEWKELSFGIREALKWVEMEGKGFNV